MTTTQTTAHLSPAVAAALREMLQTHWSALPKLGSQNDQAAFDQTDTLIANAIGMSIDEAAAEIHGFVEENA